MSFILEDEYEPRKGTSNSGFENEYFIPALFVLRVVGRTDIIDMSLATNVKNMGAFDDVIFYLEYENQQKSVYIIQLKHTKDPITASSLKKSKDYGIYKYQEDYEKIVKQMEAPEFKVLENVNIKDINFIIYSTSRLSLPLDTDIMKQLNLTIVKENINQKDFILLNTNVENKECIYKFKLANGNQKSFNENFLSQFYLFTDQGQIDTVELLIQKLISERYGYQNESIKLSFLDYLKKWGRGDLRINYSIEKIIENEFKNSCITSSVSFQNILKKVKGINPEKHYKLKKRNVQLKLTELLLESYLVEPNSFTKFKNGNLWNDLVNSIDISIVENYNQEMIPVIWHAINSNLHNYCGRKLKDDTSWKTDTWLTIDDLSKEIGKTINISMKHFYTILWKIGCLPLLLKADDKNDLNRIVNALLISKEDNCKKHVILLFKTEDANFYELFKSFSVIKTLADVHDKDFLKNLLENMSVSLQERKFVKLSKLIDIKDEIFNDIPLTLVLIMLYRVFMVGAKNIDVPKNYIKRKVRRVLLKNDVLKLQKSKFIIHGSSDVVQDIKLITDPWRVIDGKKYFKEISAKNVENGLPNVIALEEGYEMKHSELQHFTSGGNHYLHYYSGRLEWIHSTGPISDIRNFLYEKSLTDLVDEDRLLEHFTGKVNVISANPGMGKSVMVNFLADKCWSDHWVEIIMLSGCCDEIPDVFSTTPSENKDSSYAFYKNFKNTLINILKTKKKVLYLIDAFDELLPDQTECIMAGLKRIKNNSFPLWVTTRPIKKFYLEEKLNAFCLGLDNINEDDQILFFKRHFGNKKGENTDLFITHLQAIISKTFSKFNLEFSSVPLHLYMIAEVFEDKSIDELISWKEINTTDLYETFILKKIKIYLSKTLGYNMGRLNRVHKNEIERARSLHAKAALLIFYQKNILEKIINLQEIDNFIEDIVTGEENIGIITSITPLTNLPIFIHRTFAEYLTAEFLASQISNEKIKPLLHLLFKEELTVIRELFDRILAKDHPLHLAILNNALEDVKALLNERDGVSDLDYDLGGRTPLHLASAWGIRHRFPKTNSIRANTKLSFECVIINEPNHKLIFESVAATESLKIICDANKFSNQADNILGWCPVDYATYSFSIDGLDILLSNKQIVDFSQLFNLNSLTYYCVKYGYKNILQTLPLESYIFESFTYNNLFHIATENQKHGFDVLQILLNKCDSKVIRLYLMRMNEEGKAPLMCAGLKGDLNIFKTFLQHRKNIDLNKYNVYGLTLLHCLVFYNYKDCLEELLLNSNIDVNKKTEKNCKQAHTALYFATNNNNRNIVQLLIEKGADIHFRYENKRTLLHVASINGFKDCIEELYHDGVDVNSSDENGKTPLHYAIQNVKSNSIKHLLELGADINKADTFGRTFLHYAVRNLKIEDLNLSNIFTLSTLNAKDKNGKTILHYVLKIIKVDKINYLLPLGKNHNHWHHYRSTPTCRASKEERLCNIQFLINLGANINDTDNSGQTPLLDAVVEGDLEIIECFIKLGADINKCDNDNRTPLFNAVQLGKANVIKCLLDYNPDVNKHDTFKSSPLHAAVKKGFIQCVQMLISNEANINLSASDGCTPLFLAVMKNNDKLVKLLIENGANVNRSSKHSPKCITSDCSEQSNKTCNSITPLQMAIQVRNIKIINHILESKIKINQIDDEGWTALHFAADSNCVECIGDLIRKGGGLHLQDLNGCTPIHLAIKRNNKNVLQALLNVSNCIKAINMFDNNTLTALHIAASNGFLECVKMLVDKGADVQVCTSEGFTPLDLAIKQGHIDVQGFLKRA